MIENSNWEVYLIPVIKFISCHHRGIATLSLANIQIHLWHPEVRDPACPGFVFHDAIDMVIAGHFFQVGHSKQAVDKH
jgi:hypothetical protein